MAYTVLARRYRSQTFDDVLGQDVVAQTLRNAIAAGRVAHAYLFCGTRGCGKTTMARILAKSLNCLAADGPTVTPCLKCDSCIAINTGDDIDVIEIDGASNNKVENVRELTSNAIYRPARARFKIYIIDEVHMLTDSAFNALLKTLEEPPDHVKFIFATTEPNKVLATIQSRCQRFDFHNIPPDIVSTQVSKILKEEGISFEPDLLVHLARLANGSMRDALSLLDQLISAGTQPLNARQLIDLIGIPDRQKVTVLLTAIADHAASPVLQGLDALLLTGQSAAQICEAMIEIMREAMVFQCAGRDSALLVLTDEERTAMADLAGKFDIAGLVYNITALEKLRWTLKNSETSRALLEASLLRLALSEHFIGIDQLAAQVRAMPAGPVDVKKKSLTAVRSSGFSPLETPGGTFKPKACGCEDSEERPAPQDADALCRQWPQVAERVGRAVGAGLGLMLPQSRATAVKANALELSFPDTNTGPMARSICEERKAAIEKELSAVAGRPIALTFASPQTARPDEPADTDEPNAAELFEPEKPEQELFAPAKPTRQQRSDALNDPAVQMVLQGLNATPISIEKIETVLPAPESAPDHPAAPDVELEEYPTE